LFEPKNGIATLVLAMYFDKGSVQTGPGADDRNTTAQIAGMAGRDCGADKQPPGFVEQAAAASLIQPPFAPLMRFNK